MNFQSVARSFDPANLPQAYYFDPYPFFHALRQHEPVHNCPDGSFYLTQHTNIHAVYRNPKLFSSDKTRVFKPLFGDSPLYQHHTTSLVFNDPPLHTQVRKAFGNALSPRTVTAMQTSVEVLVDGLLDHIEEKRCFDLVEDFAAAIPIEVIGNLLRIPHGERGLLRRWLLAILGALEFRMTPQRFTAGNRAVTEFLDYLRHFVPRRRRTLTDAEDDLLARLIRWESEGFRLNAEALYHQLIFLLNAGHETTTNLISNGILALLQRPDQLQLLQTSPQLLDSAIEGLLRFETPIQLNNRITTETTKIADITIPAGRNLTLCITAANRRDPAVFEQPDRLDIARNPNAHFAFGSGIHTCAGLHIARLEGRVAIARMLKRFPHLRLNGKIERAHRARFQVILSAPMSLE
jgi:cytochrome P450